MNCPMTAHECRAEPWANHGRDQNGQRRALTETPAPQGQEPARGGTAQGAQTFNNHDAAIGAAS